MVAIAIWCGEEPAVHHIGWGFDKDIKLGKKKHREGESTDDEIMNEELDKVY